MVFVCDAQADEHRCVVVFERWSHCTLQQLVEERGAVTEEEARYFLEQIKFGLQLLRDKKIRHPVSPTLPLQCRPFLLCPSALF